MAIRRDRRAWTGAEDMALLLRAAMNRGRRRRDGGSIAAWARAHNRTVAAAYTRLRELRADPALRPPEMSASRAPHAVEPPQAPAPRGAAGQ